MLSTTEADVTNKTPNVNISFYKTVLDFIRQSLGSRKKKWIKELLIELTNKPIRFRSINDLGKSTHLDNVVYPILAKLHRQGLVEARQNKDVKGIILKYRLTKKGLMYSKEILA